MSSGDWWARALAMFSGVVGSAVVCYAVGVWMDDRKWKGDEE